MSPLFLDRVESALGTLLLVSDGTALCALDFGEFEARLLQRLRKRFGDRPLEPLPNPHGWSDRLRAYLRGDWSAWQSIPLNPGGTPFQQQVWTALRSLAVGEVITYGELARQIGHPQACRAVGLANGQNPIAIVQPCHRVIGAQARLTGYAGGLERKRWLLHHEGALLLP